MFGRNVADLCNENFYVLYREPSFILESLREKMFGNVRAVFN